MCSAKTNKSSSDFIFGSVSSSSSLSSSELQTRFILQPCSLLHCVAAAMEKQIFSLLSPLLYLPPSSHKTYTSTPRPSNSKWDPRSIKTWRGSHFRRISCQVSMQPWLSTHWSCCFFFFVESSLNTNGWLSVRLLQTLWGNALRRPRLRRRRPEHHCVCGKHAHICKTVIFSFMLETVRNHVVKFTTCDDSGFIDFEHISVIRIFFFFIAVI